MKFRFALLFSAVFMCAANAAFAADPLPRAVSIPAPYAVDAQTIAGAGLSVTLWGVEAVHERATPEGVRARAYLDDLMGDRSVRCIQAGAITPGTMRGQCLNNQEKDLGLQMVAAGLVAVNRRDIAGNALAAPYLAAERQARATRMGVWGGDTVSNTPAPLATGMPGNVPVWVAAAALVLVPLLGFLIIGVIMNLGFKQLITLQKYQLAGTQKRERQLKTREKYVIASALENELNTNRAKLDAFVVIYEELLKSLRDPSRTPKYKRAGDVIHEKPSLARTVYDSHINKLELLGPQLATDVSNLYAFIDANPDYRTLEPELPIEKARETVDRIVRSAVKMIEPMDKVTGALAVIVRDKRSSGLSGE